MIYRQKNRKKPVGIKIFFAIFILFVLFRIFNVSFLISFFDRPIHYVLESNVFFLEPFKKTIVYFKTKSELQNEIDALKKENTNLKVQTIFEQTKTHEFEIFKNQFASTTASNTIAKVILKPPFLPFDTITIVGELSNHKVDDLVFYNTILIGKIIWKDNTYAKVELFSTPNKIIPISVDGVQFEAKGLGGGRYVFEVSKEFQVSQGDPIIFPEKELAILGVVELIESKESDLFKKIYFNIPVSLESLSYVTVGI